MKTKNKLKLLLSFAALFSVIAYAQVESVYRNPVVPGDFPDPSVIRAGDTYYVAGTSSEWAEPYRLYESKDLINWQYLGGLFREMPEWTMGSYWAPELYYNNGTYFVYYTARRKSDKKSFIGVAATKDVRQGFTDHGLIVEWTNEAIDAFVVEIDGKRYITWKAYGLDQGRNIEILGAELSDDGLRVVGKAFNLLTADTDGWEAGGMEGQCLVKRGEYIYMFYAGNGCCGRGCNYQTGVARAKSIQGPWEKYSGNPILYGDDHWRCSGHGTLVETPDRRSFFMYHAYNAATDVYLGRQGMLDEVIWDKTTGWPAFRYGKTPSLQAAAPVANTVQQPVPNFTDHFSAPLLRKEWEWDVSYPKPVTEIHADQLKLQGSETPIGSCLGLQVKKANYTFTVTIPENTQVSTGMCIYGTRENAIGLSVEGRMIKLWQVKQNDYTILAERPVDVFPVSLCLRTQYGQYCQFGVMEDNHFQPVGVQIHLHDLPQWDRSPLVGIQVRGTGTGLFNQVSLEY